MIRFSYTHSGIVLVSSMFSAFAFAGGTKATSLGTSTSDIPNVLIVQVPEAGGTEEITDQRTDGDVNVFALRVDLLRMQDGTLDIGDIRDEVLDLMKSTTPITVSISTPDQTFAGLPADLQAKFLEAEADSQAESGSDEALIAWRGYGPAGGYSRGVVAFNANPYRGYYPYYLEAASSGHNPYFGYYANGRNYPFTYVVHRSSPSYHYFGYIRNY